VARGEEGAWAGRMAWSRGTMQSKGVVPEQEFWCELRKVAVVRNPGGCGEDWSTEDLF
jgi:hypothetical protein